MLYPNGSAIRPQVSSPFGPRPNVGAFSFHYGADLIGYETVRAAGAGRVTFAGWMNSAAGNTVVIDLGGGVTELHMHLGTFAVRKGDQVTPGSALGAMGATGNATGKCDHFEIRINGTSVEPLAYVAARLASSSGKASTTSKETDMDCMILINGKIYALAPGFIKHCDSTNQVREAQARGVKQYDYTGSDKLNQWGRALDFYGVPRDAISGNGYVLNPQSGKHESGGLWTWSRAVLAKLK